MAFWSKHLALSWDELLWSEIQRWKFLEFTSKASRGAVQDSHAVVRGTVDRQDTWFPFERNYIESEFSAGNKDKFCHEQWPFPIFFFFQKDSRRRHVRDRERRNTSLRISDVPFKRMSCDPEGRVYAGTPSKVILCFWPLEGSSTYCFSVSYGIPVVQACQSHIPSLP